MIKFKPVFFEIPTEDYNKLLKIVNSGKYATKVDFFRSKIREEAGTNETKKS